MSKSTAALAERLIEILRPLASGKRLRRADAAFSLGLYGDNGERTLRLAREIAEVEADFPIGIERGYTRLWTRSQVAREMRWRRKMRMPYKFLLLKARPKQQQLFRKPTRKQTSLQQQGVLI